MLSRSAGQPLVVAPPPRGEVPLIRKLQQAMPRERVSTATLARNGPLENIQEEEDYDHRRRELESQKARIVAQMVPVSTTTNTLSVLTTAATASTLNLATSATTVPPSRPVSMVRSSVTDENVPPASASVATTASTVEVKPKKSTISIPTIPASASKNARAYDVFAHTLTV